MNIVLIPYTFARHIATSLVVGGAALLWWWVLLHWIVWAGPTLEHYRLVPAGGAEGTWFLCGTAATVAAASILAEQTLRRSPIYRRLLLSLAAGAISFGMALVGIWMTQLVTWLFVSSAFKELAADSSTVVLRYRWLSWLAAGVASGLGPVLIRRFAGFFYHFFGGLTAAGMASVVWQWLGYPSGLATLVGTGDLYLASALACFTWGAVHGLLVWPIPDELYAGWIRVLSDRRFAWRVPVDRLDGALSERFVGHFPRGMDLFLPVEDGVAELHISILVREDQTYAVRGLSQQPTQVKRMLEGIDLRYDPRRPAPLETDLKPEDRIEMGQGDHTSEIEFLMLPREEA